MKNMLLLIPAVLYAVVFILSKAGFINRDLARILCVILVPISIVWIFLSAFFVFPIGI